MKPLFGFRHAPGKFLRNLGVVDAFLRLPFVGSHTERAQLLAEFESWIAVKRAELVSAEIEAEEEGVFKGAAGHLVTREPWLREHLRSLKHLGVLHDDTLPSRTRWDYTKLLGATLLRAKQDLPRFHGLGSSRSGSSLTGLVICQLWALIFNAGHLWGTHATERALLFYLVRNRAEHHAFLADCPSEIRPVVRKILRSESLYEVARAIGAWRFAKSCRDADLRQSGFEALEMLLRVKTEPRAGKLLSLFERARQIAYLRMHGAMGIGTHVSRDAEQALFVAISESEASVREKMTWSDVPLGRYLDSIDRYQFETFFTGQVAGSRVLTHVREFKRWWAGRANRGEPVPQRLSALFSKPTDWPSLASAGGLIEIERFELPRRSTRWTSEVQRWWDHGKPWKQSNFFLSYPPEGPSTSITIASAASPTGAEWSHIGSQLARHCRRARTGATQRLCSAAVGKLVARLLEPHFPDEFSVRFHAATSRTNNSAESYVAWAASSKAALGRHVRELAGTCSDEVRAIELGALSRWLESSDATGDGTWVGVLGSTLIVNTEEDATHELDGVVCLLSPEGTHAWWILEFKDGHRAGARKQLQALEESLRRGSSGLEVQQPSLDRSSDPPVATLCLRWSGEIVTPASPS